MKLLSKHTNLAVLTVLLLTLCLSVREASANFNANTDVCGEKGQIYDTASAALISASVIVTGEDIQNNPCKVLGYINMLRNAPYLMQPQFAEGLKFTDAVAFLKKFVAQPGSEKIRHQIIRAAFYEVYGRADTLGEQIQWDDEISKQEAWYATIVMKNIKIAQNPNGRADIIYMAYMRSMGRKATSEEEKYWVSRTEHYRLIVQANRVFLHSAKGKEDFQSTSGRAVWFNLTGNNKQLPQIAKKDPQAYLLEQLKLEMPKFAENKWIFLEMIGGEANFQIYQQEYQNSPVIDEAVK